MSNGERAKPVEQRRRFLRSASRAAVGLWLGGEVAASDRAPGQPERTLGLYHTHTHEALRARYYTDGEYDRKGLAQINYILRDHRTDEVKPIDHRLLDLLHALSAELATEESFHIISGYRSPATNRLLSSRSGEVASESLHVRGMAADIRLPNVPLARVRDRAAGLQRGGVGVYPTSNFVHVDVGRVRHWSGT